MKYPSSFALKFCMLIFTFMSSSYAADGKWSDGFGQGDYEYSIEVKKYRLFISCPTENGNASASSYVEFSDSGKELKSFEISVGGKKYQGPFEASSRVGANNFTALLDDLKKSDAVVSFKGGSVTLPKSNAASVLPSYGKKGFACNLDDVPSQTSSSQSNKSSTNEAKLQEERKASEAERRRSSASSATSSSRPSSGTITRIDTSTGNVAISGFSRVTVGKGTSITVNGNRVKNEGDLMVGDRCTVRMESYDLYAQNLVCSR